MLPRPLPAANTIGAVLDKSLDRGSTGTNRLLSGYDDYMVLQGRALKRPARANRIFYHF